MFSILGIIKPYLVAAAFVSVIVLIGGSYMAGRSDGRESLLKKLAADRVVLLQDGKRIDETVYKADDAALCILIGGCGSE